jgi:GTP-binding protein
MAFVDEVTIQAKAGRGGDGVVRWRHEKYINKGGPWGGDGGRGGDVYAIAVRNVHLLSKYRTKKVFKAGNGEHGGSRNLEGENGKTIDIEVPVGSIITHNESGKVYRLDGEGDRVLLLTGGSGGFGNTHFKSSTNVTPKESTPGKVGEEGTFYIEVELIADIGLIGLPSAGKTSLLNSLTHAHGKVGAYPFTTLEPNLGECYGYIIADVPGLIEGSSAGKGLGHRFLRHIRRTRVLVHLISVENEDPLIAYNTIKDELKSYDETLMERKEIVVVSKTDLVDEDMVSNAINSLSSLKKDILTVSIHDEDSLQKLRQIMIEAVQ